MIVLQRVGESVDVAQVINEWDLQVWIGRYEWAAYLHNVAGQQVRRHQQQQRYTIGGAAACAAMQLENEKQ